MDDALSVFDGSIRPPGRQLPGGRQLQPHSGARLLDGDIPHVRRVGRLGHSHRPEPPSAARGGTRRPDKRWTLTGVITLQSGVPVAVTQTTNNNAFAGFGTQRPNLVGHPERRPASARPADGSTRARSPRRGRSRLARAPAPCADPASGTSTWR